ncbi:MAG TPA: pantoate--beta-alanine ligase [Desulfitobacteriaceae bacterium]|nr:pantoate--beta-alanine ligase [Desulfitobacteriaceae bacterium]
MLRVTQITELRQIISAQKRLGKSIAFVPTMGYLHRGHLSLVDYAKGDGVFIVMSLFVNPMQFGPKEDFTKYPRDLARDAEMAEKAGVDLLFYPDVAEMYPQPVLSYIDIDGLAGVLCGASRPGHFRGVCTVVGKLFNIVQADKSYFGQKDYQQYLIIKRMAADLNFAVEVIAAPIVREDDGLAMSSRNVYLSPVQRTEALVLNRSLAKAELEIRNGQRDARAIEEMIKEQIIQESSGQIDYVEVRDATDLTGLEKIKGKVLIALAVRFGTTRLIDNKVVEVEENV